MRRILEALLIFLLFISCQEIIEVEVDGEEPRLIVDAVIEVDTNAITFEAEVKVSLTSSFFGTSTVTELSQIILWNGGAVVFLLEDPVGSGVYKRDIGPGFFTSGGELILFIDYLDKHYYASTEYAPGADIDTVFQRIRTTASGTENEIIVRYTDDPEVNNYYLFDFGEGEYVATDDQFYNGEETQLSYVLERDFEPGEELEVRVLGASENYYDYMKLLLEQSDDELSFFDTPVSAARGNVFDITDLDNIDVFDNVDLPDNFPLGYFAVSQVFKRKIILE